MPENQVPQIWGESVTQFKNTLPVVVALRNKALKPRHWEVITSMIGQELDLEDEEFTLGGLLAMGVDQHMEAIMDVSGKATAEQGLEEMLDKVKKTWEDLELVINPYKDSKDVFVLGSIEDITVALEDSLVTISTIAGSRYVGPIRAEVRQKAMQSHAWSIFNAGDIKKQLPGESAKFQEIVARQRLHAVETYEYAVALKAATKPGRLELFKKASETLDQIQKQLEDYLLSKCVAFPRFFFLSNDELLEILSQAKRPQAVQPHLRKCFDNLVKLKFGDGANSTDIHAMISGEGEEIPFYKMLKARNGVEKWLSAEGGVEEYMVKTMRAEVKKGWETYALESDRKEWVRKQYCQVMITVGSIYWTLETEEVLTASDGNKVQLMGKWYQKNKTQLEGLTELIRDKLNKLQRKGVVALVTQDVHNRDIIQDLFDNKITSMQNFKWQQQLRYYWDAKLDGDHGDCCIRQVDAFIMYGHEYMGALSRLVITPLTDRCWMTITGALHIKLGAAPAGPAGTGKTESTKDLAKGLARQCVVFNCSDQINYQMMGKLYSGVVSAGAWTCLDEFNRISIEVLSVVAQQVLEIRQALLQDLTEFVFESRQLKVKNTCGIFITMNPGYAGRTELPDNLKVLFRPVAMMVPDYTLIAEIMLFAEGCEVLDCHVPPKPLLSDTFRLDALSQGPKRSQRAQQKLSRITSLLMELKLQVLGVDGNGFSLRIPDDLLGWELYRRLCLRLPDKPGAIPVLCMKDSKLDLAITLRETLRPSAPTEPYRVLSFGDRFDESIERLTFPNALERLSLGDSFDQNLDLVRFPDALRELSFGLCFNQDLERVSWPKRLQHLSFGWDFNHSLACVDLPESLLSITFGYSFDQSLACVNFPNSLQHLGFGFCFNHPLEDVTFPENLKSLSFGHDFNQSLKEIAFPVMLQSLKFGACFQHDLDEVDFPPNLQLLSLGPGFDSCLNAVNFPQSLCSLSLTGLFNQPLERVQFPAGLQNLTLGYYFNQSLKEVKLPEELQSLTLGNDFNQSWLGVHLPKHLQTLNFGGTLKPSAGEIKLPSSLQSLVLSKQFNQSIEDLKLPDALENMILAGDFNQSLDSITFPKSLKSLTLAGDFNQPLHQVEFPGDLVSLNLGFRFNQSLEKVNFPAPLQKLSFGHDFDQLLDSARLPEALESLSFGRCYDQSLEKVKLPRNLTSLEFNQFFNQSLKTETLPSSLQSLTLGQDFNQSFDLAMPHLESLTFGQHFDHPFLGDFPQLEKLVFGDSFNQSLDASCPRLQELTLGSAFNQNLEDFHLPLLQSFGKAKVLSGKFTNLYKLSSEQLSKQDHYDFGMRAVKSVLVMAGSLKRADPDEDENILLIRAMRDSNVPKFLSDDLPLFFAIVNDLFPGIEVPYYDYGALQVEIERGLQKQSLQVHDKLVTKTIQLFETFMVRFGVMLVGPTLGGKSVDYKTLAIVAALVSGDDSCSLHKVVHLQQNAVETLLDALTQLREDNSPDERYQKTKYTCFNPKGITMGELYGENNELTQEWTDGLGSRIMRGYQTEESPDYKWTVFDGPVDAIWIENMNTVLDDNMTLCLANGERIKLNWTMRMLFEVEDLRVASPATVSRCGMVYLTPSDLGWEPFVRTWLSSLPDQPFSEKAKDMIWSYFDTHVQRGLDFLRKNGLEPVGTQDTQLVISLCRLFQSVMNEEAATGNSCASKDAQVAEGESVLVPRKISTLEAAEFEKFLQPCFCFAFTWTIGGSCDAKTRGMFAREIENWFPNVSMPRGGGPYDGFINFYEGPKWKSWTDIVPKFVFQDGVSYFQLLVPNPDTVRFSYIMDRMMTTQNSVFLTGNSGVGKSVNVVALLEKMKEIASVVPVYMTFSAQTKAYETQINIESKLERWRKTLLGAPVNKTNVILIDDVNMPLVEEYGAQPPIEQFQDQRGFFDRKKHEWKDIENTTLLLCAAPPGGGRNQMTARFTRHSQVVCMPPTSEEAMSTIFGSIISGFLGRFKSEVQGLANASVQATIDIYNKWGIPVQNPRRCGDELLPTPTRPHYTFNLRDVSKVFQGLLMVKAMHVPNAEAFTRLWYHELSRVFCDRLINKSDKEWFYKAAAEQLKSRFRVMDTDPEIWTSLMWCNFLRPVESRVYEEAKDKTKVQKVLEDANDDYNLSHTAQMNLVFFQEQWTLELRQDLLLGENQREVVAGYGIDAFREDEKKFLISAGAGAAKATMFLLSDTQIINETFLEDFACSRDATDINNILNAGEAICGAVRGSGRRGRVDG
ncbi:Dynein axonemal heavy chain 6 (Axonemal beta dynein heavy chain 6) (Ciliary dynein heavy chain 6) [Durusdinium trenchii]|uniref:Dynein axonemal heavy chain 6 (Axonemal beta dynein heavy chain 6) (Ciliary dynein heavy chain 6) n=1 Tax=Durusdinium trenchii TaxID=1381693 RepID=A0ABP0RHN7_9DINO